jgi:NADPH-dependent glutamate synthase beta subunit-like oxidoreductase
VKRPMDANTVLAESFGNVDMLYACEQCGCCASACPVTGKDDFNIRRMVRYIEMGMAREAADSGKQWVCTTCGRCETVCPNGIALLDIIRPLRVLTPENLMPPEGPPPCSAACPAGIDVPAYLRFIAGGKPGEALAVILEKVPFPGILGRVCMHPCEAACRRGEVNRPIAVCALKRYAADRADDAFMKIPGAAAATGRKAAVVGAGPAGLTAAFYLRGKGHEVTVFEARPKPGGMMRYGIPSYRLPEDVLDREIDRVLGTGIRLQTGMKLGRDLGLDSLRNDFDAVFIATGLQESRKIDLAGSDSEDVLWGVDFLSDVAEGREVRLQERVLVVGGGNVAVDVALTALRTGAGEVAMACLEKREEMPANEWEIQEALEEGVRLMPAWGPGRILRDGEKVTGVELVQCASVFDEKGNFCPAFGELTERVAADQVILAVGQSADLSFAGESGLDVERGLIRIHEETMETGVPGVYAGGDVGKGPGAVIDAIAAGRRAARSMDRFLGGDGEIDGTPAARRDTSSYDGARERGFADMLRMEQPVLPLDRRGGFDEVALCLSDEDAAKEASRCLQCDLEACLIREYRSGR